MAFESNSSARIRSRKPSLRSIAGPGLAQHSAAQPCDEKPAGYFLDSCFLCKARLHVGDEIYMYRGDTPFCSEECRQEQIEIDETEEEMNRLKMLSKKNLIKSKIFSSSSSTTATTTNKSYKIHSRAARTVVAG